VIRILQVLIQLDIDLRELGIRWVLVGGLAVSARAEPRTTRDVDAAVAVADDREAERYIWALRQRGYAIHAPLEQEAIGRLATVRLLAPREHEAGGIIADLLFASSGIEPEVVAAGQPLEIVPGFIVPVATVGHLLALKTLSASPLRPQDTTDALALIATATPEDLDQARASLDLITARGFNRGKDLRAELDQLLRGSGRVVDTLPG
jgi:hypothetical protein